MKNLTCTQCGGQIDRDRMTCPYCGTKYKLEYDDHVIRVETFQNPVKIYKSTIEIPEYEISRAPEEMSKYVIDCLAHNLADAFKENMEIETVYNPSEMVQKISARVRIIEPKHLF